MHQFWVPERPLWKCKLVKVRFFTVSVGYATLSKTKVLSRRSFLQSLCSVFGSPGNLVNVSQNMILDTVLERLLHLAHLVVSGHSISETRLGGGCNFFSILFHFYPDPWQMIQFDMRILFRWVGSTTTEN